MMEVTGCGPESFQFLYEVSGAAERGRAEYLAHLARMRGPDYKRR